MLNRNRWGASSSCRLRLQAPLSVDHPTRPIVCHAIKAKSIFVCPKCKQEHSRWGLSCDGCGGGGLAERKQDADTASALKSPALKLLQSNGTPSLRKSSWIAPAPSLPSSGSPVDYISSYPHVRSLADLNDNASSLSLKGQSPDRIKLSGRTGLELGRCLCGPAYPGIVNGSFVLIGGDPGIGKSTLLLQLAAMISSPDLDCDSLMAEQDENEPLSSLLSPPSSTHASQAPRRLVLYISGEEKQEALMERARRMGVGSCKSLFVASMSSMDEIFELVDRTRPCALIVDSIQTIHMEGISGSHGSVSQVKECGQVLRQIANTMNIAVFLIGHVTKSGEVAGPKLLEHIVDTVLFLEGESGEERRLLRVMKNRHGPTDEVGVFTMGPRGMRAVEDALRLFVDFEGLDRSSEGAGSTAILGSSLMGNRAVLVEVQALCSRAYSQQSPLVRQATGVSKDRFNQLCHVISKVCPALRGLTGQHIYASVIKGASYKEPAADLTMALSIASSFFDVPLPSRLCAFGEIDLAGKVRQVNMVDKRLAEVIKSGDCDLLLVPTLSHGAGGGFRGEAGEVKSRVRVVEVGTLVDALREVLGAVVDQVPNSKRGKLTDQESQEGWGDGDEAEEEDGPLMR
jgi:DNA repair protein RadA/Sms